GPADGRGDEQAVRLGDRVRDVDRLDGEGADRKRLARPHDGDVDVFDDAVPCPLGRQHGGGEGGSVDGLVEDRPEVEHGAVVVFVAMGKDQRQHIVGALLEKFRIGHDEFDARQVRPAEADAAIHDDPFAPVLRPEAVCSHVHADLADAAERHEDEFIPLVFRHGFFLSFHGAAPGELWSPVAAHPVHGQLRALAVAPKCTSPAVMVVRAPLSSRMTSRPAVSMVSKMPRRTTPSWLTATAAPMPAAAPRHSFNTALTPAPSAQRLKASTQASDRASNTASAGRSVPRSRSEVAGEGGSVGAAAILMPMPTTMAARPWGVVLASSGMPAGLAPSAARSLGHLSAMRGRPS